MSDNLLPILRQDNVLLLTQSAPDIFNSNALSAQKCSDFGQLLLSEIQLHGMTDDLDRRCADYIEKAKRTVKTMNERRSPVTKLFDSIRSEFTGMENQIDPSRKDTIPFAVQQHRNAYAAKKRDEAERRRQEQLRLRQHEQALSRYRLDAEDDFRRQFDALVSSAINTLTSINQGLTLASFDVDSAKLRAFSVNLSDEWFDAVRCVAQKPFEISDDEAASIRSSVLGALHQQFCLQYQTEVADYRDSILDTLPAKKAELQRMAAADAEEQERIKRDLQAREAAELRRLDDERKRKDDEAKAAKAVRDSAGELDGLFALNASDAPHGASDYQPKTSVRKRILPLDPDGILAVVSLWWGKEGQFLPLDDLAKLFKKQIAFCEKLANDKDAPCLISSPSVRYEEEVKAK